MGPQFSVTGKYSITEKFLRSYNSVLLKELTLLFQEYPIPRIQSNAFYLFSYIVYKSSCHLSSHPNDLRKWSGYFKALHLELKLPRGIMYFDYCHLVQVNLASLKIVLSSWLLFSLPCSLSLSLSLLFFFFLSFLRHCSSPILHWLKIVLRIRNLTWLHSSNIFKTHLKFFYKGKALLARGALNALPLF